MRYRLTARAFEGPLFSPTRNETYSEDSDSRAELEDSAQGYARVGFHVWVYERVPRGPMDPDRLTVVCEFRRFPRGRNEWEVRKMK